MDGRGKRTLANFQRKFSRHLKYCLSVSSVHGLNHLARSELTVIEKLAWICMVAASFYLGLSKSLEIFVHYRTRPTVMAMETDYIEWLAEFPSVTVCQRNIYPEKARQFFKQLNRSMEINDDFESYLNLLASTDIRRYHLLKPYADGTSHEYLKPEEYITFLLHNLDFIYENGVGTIFPMNEVRPILPVLTEVGFCATMNPYLQIYNSPEYLNRSDPYNFKPLKYNMTTDDIMDFRIFQEIENDFEVYIHSPYEIINIESKPFQGKATYRNSYYVDTMNIYTKPEVKNLNVEQRGCKLIHESEGLHSSPVYSYGICRNECRMRLSQNLCQCTPYYYRRDEGDPICNMTGMYCLSKYANELISLYDHKTNKSLCDCYPNCDNVLVIFDKYVGENFLISTDLIVSISKNKQARYVRNLIFSKLDMLVQIGGTFGLCLGCSILSIIEVIYFATLRFFWGTIREKSIKSSL